MVVIAPVIMASANYYPIKQISPSHQRPLVRPVNTHRIRGGHRLSSDTKNVAMATFIVAQETKNGVGVKLVPRFSFR
jgi:hypothetical protein